MCKICSIFIVDGVMRIRYTVDEETRAKGRVEYVRYPVDEETRAKGRVEYLTMAQSLDALATSYRKIALGQLNQHSDEAEDLGHLARHIIKKLVQEWL